MTDPSLIDFIRFETERLKIYFTQYPYEMHHTNKNHSMSKTINCNN